MKTLISILKATTSLLLVPLAFALSLLNEEWG